MVKDLIKPIGIPPNNQEHYEKRDSVIYKLKCMICDENNITSTYIGETGRMLQTRLNEHFRRIRDKEEFDSKISNMSQIQKHMFLFHPTINSNDHWKIEILNTEKNIQDRKVVEALEIKKHVPTLNADKGISLVI